MNIGIYIYHQAEVLDFAGPFEVFSTASRICENDRPFNTFLVAESTETVHARGGFTVQPNFGFHDHPPIDVLIVAGGVHKEEMLKPEVIDWIARRAKQTTITASVCTGAFLLAQAEVLQAQKVTSHWEDIPDLRRLLPTLDLVEGVRWVDEGSVVTSGGISAGIDISLHLVGKLYDYGLAEKTARQMEFSWTKNT